MAYSAGENVVQAMTDALNAPAVKPCKTYRTRIDAIATAELPVMVLFAVEETPELKSTDRYLRTRRVRLEAMVAGEPPADRLTDALYVYAVNTLLADANLRPIIRKLREAKVMWETEPSYQDTAVAAIDFEVVFVTSSDPTVRLDT